MGTGREREREGFREVPRNELELGILAEHPTAALSSMCSVDIMELRDAMDSGNPKSYNLSLPEPESSRSVSTKA